MPAAVDAPRPRTHTLRALVWCCVVLMLVVTTASAWLRLAQPRPPCANWPDCRSAQALRLPEVAPAWLGDAGVVAAVRATHRVAATLVLLAVIALVTLAFARQPRHPGAGRPASAMLAVALGLSVLGVVTPRSQAAAVLLGNLLGGMALLALAWVTLRRLHSAAPLPAAGSRWAFAAAAAWWLQAALGALAGADRWPAAPVIHVAVGLTAAPLALAVGWAACTHGRRREGGALVALAAAQIVLGAAGVATDARAAVVLAHNTCAAIGLALLAGLADRFPTTASAPTRSPP
jgi:heme A synthase